MCRQEAFKTLSAIEIPGFGTLVNGKALSRTEPQLASLARELGVTPLLDFCSISPDDAMALTEATGIDPGDTELPQTTWFDADTGLATANVLDDYIAKSPDAVLDSPQVRSDLAEFVAVLSRLKLEGIRWHLAVNY